MVAILNPLTVHWITIGAYKVSKEQSLDIKDRKDTSYNVANPPSNDTSSKNKDLAAY
ncbi:MAG: hypothetical protein JST87_13295 [Bacteroidetes bacterium]|nr:hypothetical protein [Bacteroidota bacterium]